MKRSVGWRKEPARHALAAKGLKTTYRQERRSMLASSGAEGLDALRNQNLGRERGGPGKFEGNHNVRLAEAFYDLTMISGQDEEAGDVTEGGLWVGFFADLSEYHIKEDGQPVEATVVTEDSNGFFSYETFSDKSVAKRTFDNYAKELG